MTVQELIDKLEKFPREMEIFVFADHGQNYEDATSVEYLSAPDYDIDSVDELVVVVYGL